MKPYFSIIIPLYNKEKHIKTTLESVWSQTFSDFEVIVVNDGSTDNSLDVLSSIEDERLHIFSIDNKGVSHARNYGVLKATSDLIVFLDADDLWYEHHLQDLKELYEQFPDCGLYCKAYNKKYNNTLIASRYKDIPSNINWKGVLDNYFYSSLNNSIAWTSAVMIPKKVFNTIGQFNTNFNSGEDTDLWVRIALNYSVAFDNKVSAIHNLSSEHKITDLKLSERIHTDFTQFKEDEKTNKSLKHYLDNNRYALAIQHKLEGDLIKAKEFYGQINLSNLSTLQKFVFKLSKPLMVLTLKTRNLLRKFNLDFRLFR